VLSAVAVQRMSPLRAALTPVAKAAQMLPSGSSRLCSKSACYREGPTECPLAALSRFPAEFGRRKGGSAQATRQEPARVGPKHRMQLGSRCCALWSHRSTRRTAGGNTGPVRPASGAATKAVCRPGEQPHEPCRRFGLAGPGDGDFHAAAGPGHRPAGIGSVPVTLYLFSLPRPSGGTPVPCAGHGLFRPRRRQSLPPRPTATRLLRRQTWPSTRGSRPD
jgi:hypothetical protein